ncbi:MAG: WD40 repeat domain-containing protein, partial [Gemmataceae bacterium]
MFSPDGRALAVADERGIVLHDLASGRQFHRLSGFAAGVSALAFSPDGKTLASGHDDTTVLLWNVPLPPSLAPAKKTLMPAELDRLWQRLADAKASV